MFRGGSLNRREHTLSVIRVRIKQETPPDGQSKVSLKDFYLKHNVINLSGYCWVNVQNG